MTTRARLQLALLALAAVCSGLAFASEHVPVLRVALLLCCLAFTRTLVARWSEAHALRAEELPDPEVTRLR